MDGWTDVNLYGKVKINMDVCPECITKVPEFISKEISKL